MRRVLLFLLIVSCKKTTSTVEPALISFRGTLGSIKTDQNKPVQGMRLQFSACPETQYEIYLSSAGTGHPEPDPAMKSCLDALAVGSTVDVKLEVVERSGVRGIVVKSVGGCEIPGGTDGALATGTTKCAWQ